MQAPSRSQAPKKTFWRGAARHKNIHTTIAFVSGTTLSIPLRKNGYLAALRVNVNGTVTPGLASGTAQDADQVSNLLPFVGIKSAQGSYVHSYDMRSLIDFNFRLHASNVSPLNDPTYQMFAPGTASSQPVNVNVELPVSINDGINVETGMLMRQIPNSEFTLELRCAQASDLFGTGTATLTSTALTITIEEVWFEAVGADTEPPHFNTIVRTRAQSFGPVISGGDFEIKYPVQPTIVDAMHRIVDGGVASHANANTLSMVANHQNQVESRRIKDIRAENYRHFGKAFRTGVVLQDFCDDGDSVNETRARDFINSQAAAELNFVLNTTSAFASANSAIVTMLRELVALGIYR